MKKITATFNIIFLCNIVSLQAAIYTVVNTLDNNTMVAAGQGDLRWCINQVIANAAAGPHTINFNIPGAGPHIINAGSAYPAITNVLGGGVTIDGFSEPDFVSTPVVFIDGPGWGECFNLNNSDGSIIQGIGIYDFGSQASIFVHNGCDNVTIRGVWIGINTAGTAAAGGNNAPGIYVQNSVGCSIGGNLTLNPTYKVVISNRQDGIRFENGDNGTIRGTYIGTNVNGNGMIGAPGISQYGIYFYNGSTNNTVGGAAAGERCIISNSSTGVRLEGATTTGNKFYNNYVGTDITGMLDYGNTFSGFRIVNSHNNEIGGKAPGLGNIISGNNDTPVYIQTDGDGNLFARNYIGLAADGNTVLINGTNDNHHGILVNGSGCTDNDFFYNVIVTPNRGSGIYYDGAGGDSIVGNFIGTNATGLTMIGIGTNTNQAGILINSGSAAPNIVYLDNVVAGSKGQGIEVRGGAKNNHVFKGNKIGMNVNGMGTTFGNVYSGIYFHPSSGTNLIIGGTNPADRNIISMNGRDLVTVPACAGTNGCGIIIENVNGITIQGNYIGVDATGNTARGNGSTGIQFNGGCNNVLVGGTVPGARNIVCANGFNCSGSPANVRHGIQFVNNGSATSLHVQGNYVGLGADGTTLLGNSEEGVSSWQTPNITIGGNTPAHRNVIAGNNKGVYFQPASATGCRVQGNYIGTDATGTLARPNNTAGIHVRAAAGTLIGGTGPGEGNVISGNTNDGILLEDADNTVIQQNYIGINSSGDHWASAALPNGRDGIRIKNDGSNGTTGVLIGHTTNAALANKIAYNTANGVMILDANCTGNQIRRNAIFCNGTASVNGINLNGVGNTNISPPGPLVVPPYITAPTPGIQVANTPVGDIAATDVVEVFYDPRCGTCQGEIFLGNATNSGTQWSFSPLPAASDCSPKGVAPCISGVQNITATRTSSSGNTSQFMSCDPLLPVDLLSFKGKRYGADAALLTWVTASEKNNSHFDILRGRDISTFNVVGRVVGAGNSQNANFYDFTDFNLESGDYYYALMQVDFDGKQSMSNVVKVSINDESIISVAPNVVSAGTNVIVYNYSGDNLVSVELTDLNGKTVYVRTNILSNELVLPTYGLAPSIYNIRVQTVTGVVSEKIVVQ